MNFLIGSSGRLGQKIYASLQSHGVIKLERLVYSEWWRENAADQIAKYFEKWSDTASTIYLTAGIIDPKISAEVHNQINFLLARNIILGATQVGLRVVTFGTVMEKIMNKTTSHPYFSSKIKLGDFISDFSVKNNLALHIRIHTLYGGSLPSHFMFLGELFYSIMNQTHFKMSLGNQLREYHHIDDEIVAIQHLVSEKISGIIDISHGAPVSLRELAEYIFQQFGCSNLLKVGVLSSPSNDNYEIKFARTPLLLGIPFRDTLPAVVEYLSSCSVLGEKINGS